mmetsp:Transcript_2343/g.5148  ORF Transcript_2343/g.5148 Transcript_2343/m.5148 type:complete len:227 (-) Transcript_2343:405-1085(-)
MTDRRHRRRRRHRRTDRRPRRGTDRRPPRRRRRRFVRPRIATRSEVTYLPRRTLRGGRTVHLAPGIGIVESHPAEPVMLRIVGHAREVGRGLDGKFRGDQRRTAPLHRRRGRREQSPLQQGSEIHHVGTPRRRFGNVVPPGDEGGGPSVLRIARRFGEAQYPVGFVSLAFLVAAGTAVLTGGAVVVGIVPGSTAEVVVFGAVVPCYHVAIRDRQYAWVVFGCDVAE